LCPVGTVYFGGCGSTVQGLCTDCSSSTDVSQDIRHPMCHLASTELQCLFWMLASEILHWHLTKDIVWRRFNKSRLSAALLCRGYWANAVILLLSDSPSGGCSGLLLRPAGPSDTPKRHQVRGASALCDAMVGGSTCQAPNQPLGLQELQLVRSSSKLLY